MKSLIRFDHQTFRAYPADWFDEEDWKAYDTWWMIVSGRKVGCCAFEPHIDFREDISARAENPRRINSLYIVSTGILPACQGAGLGSLLKCWQIAYARQQGFTRVITNTRTSNRRMIRLNRKFGFHVLRTTPGYYANPREGTVVMELRL